MSAPAHDGVSARASLLDVLHDVARLAADDLGAPHERLVLIRDLVDGVLDHEERDPDPWPDEATVIAGVRASIAHTRGRPRYVVLPHAWARALVHAHDTREA